MTSKNNIALLLLLIISFLLITVGVLTKNSHIINLDQHIFAFINTVPFPHFLNNLTLIITKLGNPYQSLSLFIIFGIFLIAKREKISFYILTLATTLAALLPEMMKLITGRVRPISSLLLEPDYSFPSAHATIACVFLLAALLLIAPTIKNQVLKMAFILLSSIVFPLIALSRIYLSVHWGSDVLAGVILGAICYLASYLILKNKDSNA